MSKKVTKFTKTAKSARKWAESQQTEGMNTTLKVPSGTGFFTLKKGKYVLDILDYPAGKGNPWAAPGELHFERTYFVHKQIGPDNKSYVCPKATIGKPCPICDFRAKQMRQGVEKEITNALRPQKRQLFNIIDVTNGTNKDLLLWDVSFFCFGQQLVGEINDADDGEFDNFSDLQEGLSLRLGVDEEKGKGFSYPKVNRISFKARKKAYGEDILNDVLCLDDILNIPSYDFLEKEFLQTGDTEDVDADDDDDAPDNEDVAPKKKVAEKKVVDEDDDDDADDDDDDDAPVKKKVAAKKMIVDEDDDDDDDDDDEKPAKKGAGKKKAVADEDEDADDDDDIDIDDDDADDDEDLDLEDEDDDDDDDDDDDKPVKKQTSKKSK